MPLGLAVAASRHPNWPSSTRGSKPSSSPTVPDLLNLFGVGPDTAAALVMVAGDNPERLHSESAWAHLSGVSPIPKGSGAMAVML
jgi:hypothetical protein